MKVSHMSHGAVQAQMIQNDKVAKSATRKKKVLKQGSQAGAVDRQGLGKGKRD